MSEDSKYKIIQLDKDIAELRKQKTKLVVDKTSADKNLSEINKLVKEFRREDSKKESNAEDLRDLLLRQSNARELATRLQNTILDTNASIELKNVLKENLKKGIKIIATTEEFYDIELKAMRLKLKTLRNNYISFAADHTRISSNRRMAAEFVKDLDKILKNQEENDIN